MVAGVMQIGSFPLALDSLLSLRFNCDYLVAHVDGKFVNNWRPALEKIDWIDKLRVFSEEWNRWNWRESLIRELDAVEPDYVIFLDDDETVSEDFSTDFDNFKLSSKKAMMFDYEMVTEDNRTVAKYPRARHCKVYRWQRGLTYKPYKGYALPSPYVDRENWFLAGTPILHWCFYTKELERSKKLHR